jgi:ATP diphosphatase
MNEIAEENLAALLDIMRRLRDPKSGCPWDLEQNFASIAPHTIEEAYEVAEAIEKNDPEMIKDEVGDLLFQVVFYARLAEEKGWFDFASIASAIAEKMIRRHPHVFGQAKIDSAAAQTVAWEALKSSERQKKSAQTSALDGVSLALPALTRAVKLQKRAARIGFDWPDAAPVLDKVLEEVAELKEEMAGGNRSRMEAELGDILFSCVNLARKLEIDPESALRLANGRFERRFHEVEKSGAKTADAMEAAWEAAKRQEINSRR